VSAGGMCVSALMLTWALQLTCKRNHEQTKKQRTKPNKQTNNKQQTNYQPKSNIETNTKLLAANPTSVVLG